MFEYMGLILSLTLLIVMALKGINIFVATLLCSLVVAMTNKLSIPQALSEFFPFGPLGAFTFAGKFFILFICGAIFGKVMAVSQAARSIALAITHKLGPQHTLWIVMSVCAVLTYGGVVVFVVIFTMYPLSIALMRTVNVPKRLVCGAISLGAGTFTMTALPGTPSIHNVIAASALGTDLFAGFGIGLFASFVMLAFGMAYLQREWHFAKLKGEGYVACAQDQKMESLIDPSAKMPSPLRSLIPIFLVLGVILIPRLILAWFPQLTSNGLVGEILLFSQQQPILWPSLALIIATLFSVGLFASFRRDVMKVIGQGTEDSILPLVNTAAVVGFGGVVSQTNTFSHFSQWILSLDLPPLISAATAISVLSGIVGSATGGLQIFLKTLAPQYLEQGVSADHLHRIATVASGGLDSLPHCGAIVAILMIMGLSHKQAYKDIFVVTVLGPLLALALSLVILVI